MRLLVTTQAVDLDDPALGFFHGWLSAFAREFESIDVICLKEGRHALSRTIRVHTLGKERGRASKFVYSLRFLRRVFALHGYDAVFVHMNEEYVLLAGLWWRLTGTRVVLWRNHKMGSWRTRLAVALAHTVCYTSPESFVAHSTKGVRMPIGIDTGRFMPPATSAPHDTILFLGRIDPVKKVHTFLEALHRVTAPYRADLYGSPTDPDSAYARTIGKGVQALPSLSQHPAVAFADTPALYHAHAIYVNLTPSGSFDKTIGEAAASGCLVVSVNRALRQMVRPEHLAQEGGAEAIARALTAALSLTAVERAEEVHRLRAYVKREHSLEALVEKLKPLFA